MIAVVSVMRAAEMVVPVAENIKNAYVTIHIRGMKENVIKVAPAFVLRVHYPFLVQKIS